MSYQAMGTGTLAAAVLGVGTAAASGGAGSAAANAAGSAAANAAGSGVGPTIRLTATQMGHELARTGASMTTLLAVLGAILLIAGVLLVGLTRRHGLQEAGPAGFAPPDLL